MLTRAGWVGVCVFVLALLLAFGSKYFFPELSAPQRILLLALVVGAAFIAEYFAKKRGIVLLKKVGCLTPELRR